MNKNIGRYILAILITHLMGIGMGAYARISHDLNNVGDSIGNILQNRDSLIIGVKKDTIVHQLVRGSNGLIVMPKSEVNFFPPYYTFEDTLIVNPAYLPVVFSGEILPENLDFTQKTKSGESNFRLISPKETFLPELEEMKKLKELRRLYSSENPDKVKYKMNDLRAQKEVQKQEDKIIKSGNVFQDLITAEAPPTLAQPEVEKVVPKRIYWIKHGEHLLQISQNHISDNWHKGGNSNFTIKNEHKFTLNYEKGKVKLDNSLEWKLNFQKTPADTIRDINITEDLVRWRSNFGYKAINTWYYSSSLLAETQLFKSYPVNSNDRRMSFLSPLRLELGVGMTYNLEKQFKSNKFKKVRYSLDIAPLSLKMVYLKDDKVTERGGVDGNKTTLLEYGSKFESTLSFDFNRYMRLYSRFKYFTSYSYIEGEFENKLDLSLNRYLSTTISLYLRYDDRQSKNTDLGHFQLNEMISLGLNYRW